MNKVLFGDDQLDRNYHMKNAIANRQARAAKPGPVLKAGGGYRSGSQRHSANRMGAMGRGRGSNSLSRQNSQQNHFIKQNINQIKKLEEKKQNQAPHHISQSQMNLHHIEQEFKTESDVLLGRIADN